MTFRRQVPARTETIAAGLRSHDPQAVADLYSLMGGRVYAVILAIVRNPVTAEDLTQDTFVRAWNHSGQFEGDNDALGRWLLSIGRHRAIDFIRQTKRRVEKDSVPICDREDHLSGGWDGGRTAWADPGDALTVRDAMLRLSEQHRAVLELAYWEGLSQTEIAIQMQQPLGTVKGWTRSALKQLRDCMEENPTARIGRERLGGQAGSFS